MAVARTFLYKSHINQKYFQNRQKEHQKAEKLHQLVRLLRTREREKGLRLYDSERESFIHFFLLLDSMTALRQL